MDFWNKESIKIVLLREGIWKKNGLLLVKEKQM